MKLWPFGRAPEPAAPWDGKYRWAGEVSDTGLRFQSAGSLEAPGSLLEDLAGLSSRRISRADALRAMAVLRARNLIAGTLAVLPLEARGKDRSIDERDWVGIQPDPNLEQSVMFALTFEDLFFEGKSYWLVEEQGTEMGSEFPREARHVNIKSVSQHASLGLPSQTISDDLQFSPSDPVFIDGEQIDLRRIIRFTSPNPPFLKYAAKAIRTVLLLDQTAADYSQDPLPFGYFTDADEMGEEDQLDDYEINEVLDKWEAARRKRRWGYVASGLALRTLDWPNPEQLQLAQARNHAVLDIARGAGLDPEDVGVNIQGSSRTYQNAEQRRLDLIDFVLTPYMKAVEDRLSMRDVTPRGVFAKFDTSAFTRADFATRMESYKNARESEVYELNELRRKESEPDLPDKPAPKPPQPPQPPAPDNIPTNGDRASVGSNGNDG